MTPEIFKYAVTGAYALLVYWLSWEGMRRTRSVEGFSIGNKDMILSGGQNIYPQDIEAVLVQYPEVDDAAVIGLPSRRWGETPVALVVPVQGAELDRDALREWVNGRVGRQQRLSDVIAIDALPRNPNGKILKRELRSDFGDRTYD